ncbi:MAG: PQQ-dependent sugar dehydrogenase [Bacteroidota bacterium]
MQKYLLSTILALCAIFLSAQPSFELSFTQLASGLRNPVGIQEPNDGTDRLFIIEQSWGIREYDRSTGTLAPTNQLYLDISSQVRDNGNEQGVLGLAFHPSFATNGYFYVNYTSQADAAQGIPQGATVVSRFQAANPLTDNSVSSATEQILLIVPQPFSNHNAGDLAFGPDGYLYVTMGDGGSGGDPDDNGQDPLTMLGSILRIDVDNPSGGNNYGIPPTNPYVGTTDTLDEIWAMGVRNPWRVSFDKVNNEFWIADVGQNEHEEINRVDATIGGLDYGWDCQEGFDTYNGPRSADCDPGDVYQSPIVEFPRSGEQAALSITGGFVYRGTEFPNLVGWYICADYVTDNIFLVKENQQGGYDVAIETDDDISNVSSFGQAADGQIFILRRSFSNGRLYTISQALPVELTEFSARLQDNGQVLLNWTTGREEGSGQFIIERSNDGRSFTAIGQTPAAGSSDTPINYEFVDRTPLGVRAYYRLRQIDLDGSEQLSPIRRIDPKASEEVEIFPNPVDDWLTIDMGEMDVYGQIQAVLYDQQGRAMQAQTWLHDAGYFLRRWSLAQVPTGFYTLSVKYDGGSLDKQLIVR